MRRPRFANEYDIKSIVIVILCFIGICWGIVSLYEHGIISGSDYTVGVNGIVETRCIGGYKFTIGDRGYARQILDANGKGIPCY